MTEREWAESRDPAAMLDYLVRRNPVSGTTAGERMGNRASDRKLRLFSVACGAGANQPHLREQYGEDGENITDPARYARLWADASQPQDIRKVLSQATKADLLREIVGNPFRPVRFDVPVVADVLDPTYNPRFRGVVTNGQIRYECLPDWLTEDIIAMARDIEGRSAFDELGVLGDRLADAGCPDDEGCPTEHACNGTGRVPNRLLEHLRSPGPHYRGCWALDLVLGKE